MSYNIIPPKVKFTVLVEPRIVLPYYVHNGAYTKIVDGSMVTIQDSLNNNYYIEVPYNADIFHYKGALQPLGADQVGPSIIFQDKDLNILGSFWATEAGITELDLDLPQGTTRILAPSIKYSQPVFTFYYNEQDVTDGIINMEDVEITGERDGTSGAVCSILFPVQFGVNSTGYNLLKNEYLLNGVRSNMTLTVYEREYFNETYNVIIKNTLDFLTYEEYETYIEIGVVNSSLAELISAKGGANYDIPVSELATQNWIYRDIALNQFAKYEVPAEVDMSLQLTNSFRPVIEMAISLPEPSGDNIYRIPESIEHDVRGQTLGGLESAKSYFFRAVDAVDVSVRASINFEFEVRISKYYIFNYASHVVDPEKSKAVIRLSRFRSDGSEIAGTESSCTMDGAPGDFGNFYLVKFRGQLTGEYRYYLESGDLLSLYAKVSYPFITGNYKVEIEIFAAKVRFSSGSRFEIFFPSEFPEASMRPIRVIDPEILLQKFLDLISDKEGEYSGTIFWDTTMNHVYRLAAAESIANYEEPYFHGNLNDFIKWMYVLGYEYQYNNAQKRISFVSRDNLFQHGVMQELPESEVSDVSVSQATEMIYSRVKVGYEQQEYDNEYLNGIEVNSTFEYTTGIKGSENSLELISPYRGDAIGIQTLYRNFKESATTDRKDNDSDIFAVVLTADGYTYTDVMIDVKDSITGKTIPLFNALISPQYLVKLNESLIGISTKTLTFNSTTGNKTAAINDISIASNIEIEKRLFSPQVYSFSEGSLSFPQYMESLVSSVLISFIWRGKKLRGFVKNISRRVIDETTREWTLYAE